MLGEVGWRSHQNTATVRELPGDEPRIGDFAMADDGVIAAGSHIDAAVVEIECQRDLRMLLQEWKQGRGEMHPAKGHRRGDAQRSSELAAPLGQLSLRLLDLPQDARCALEKGCAILGQREFPRRAMQQRRAEATLQFRQPLADDRL